MPRAIDNDKNPLRQQQEEQYEETLSSSSSSSPSSWLTPTVLVILGTETAERVAYFGFHAVLILYFTFALRLSETRAISYFAYVTCLAFVSPLLGAWLADGSWGRYKTILIFGWTYWIGLVLLTTGAYLGENNNNDSNGDDDNSTQIPWFRSLTTQRWLTAFGLFLICIGTGGIKPCVSAFGADQIVAASEQKQEQQQKQQGLSNNQQHQQRREQEEENKASSSSSEAERQVGEYFAWFYFCINMGAVASVLLMPYLRSRLGFGAAFALPTASMGLALLLFWSKRNQYLVLNKQQKREQPQDDNDSDKKYCRAEEEEVGVSTMLALCWRWIQEEIHDQHHHSHANGHGNHHHKKKFICSCVMSFLARIVPAPSNTSGIRPKTATYLPPVARQPRNKQQLRRRGQHTLIPTNDDDGCDGNVETQGCNQDSIQQNHHQNIAINFDLSKKANSLLQLPDSNGPVMDKLCCSPGGEEEEMVAESLPNAIAPRDPDFDDDDDDDAIRDVDVVVERAVLQVLRVLPVMATFPMFWALYDQQGSVWTLQATRMNLHGFVLPDQMKVVNPIEILIFIPLFDRCLYPALDRYGGLKLKERPLLRMAIGMCFTAVGFSVSGVLEAAIQRDEWESPRHAPSISVFWQAIQITVVAVGEVFFSVTAMEFSYACAPKHFKAIVMALYLLTTAVGDFFSGLLYATVFAHVNRAAVMHICALLMLVNLVVFLRVAQRYQEQQEQQQDSSLSPGRRKQHLPVQQTPETSMETMEEEELHVGLELRAIQ